MCSEVNKGPYLDVRVYRSLVYFFQVQSQCNAGPYASFLTGVRDESAAMRQIRRTGTTMVWLSEPPTAAYWDQAAGLPETTITVASSPGPHGVWVTILSSAQRRDKYQVKCKHHACPGPRGLTDTYVHVHGRDKVRPEVQDAMRELLAELYASKRPGDRCPDSGDGPVRLHAMPVDMGPRTFLKPNLTPGVHFHHVTALVTVLGILLGWDAGNPSVAERQEAREEDDIEDPEGMAAAIIQEAGGG